ncbi:hypothetical protein SAMD00019534_086650 [Acytostelium subglobosum LB1]|uniref:hypothetical protein n=1 Tax=Acytostelium subglobosum LB1 TaxID=1410327 RepID=UPI00064485A0|nr:hypothetical protein SAMD00019534_086650 [Acytostelium subglobosum LB1]GAM25490.1 hypothetical protein SAMD00019534_086650 [Acytostelium subglobosum LB1]|eukprot:XP_012751476.1 hypothetical protein SAMD00019534_086650 [Acytostelium subglobosum LB1]
MSKMLRMATLLGPAVLLLLLILGSQISSAHETERRLSPESTEKLKAIGSWSAAGLVSCEMCELAAVLFEGFLERNATTEEVIKTTTDVCNTLKIEQPEVCHGLMFAYAPVVYDVLIESALEPRMICTKLKMCMAKENTYEHFNQLDRMASFGSNLLDKPNYKDVKPQEPRLKEPFTGVGYILQLADIHTDPYYVVGSNPDCGRPGACCRDGTGDAGFYGDYLCDIPLHSVGLIFEQILEVHKTYPISLVVYTGDNPPHDIWNQSIPRQVESTEVVSKLINDYFHDFVVLPSVGNHESWPSEEFILPKNQWLLDALETSWSPWLDKAELETVKKGGYYTMLVQKGLRVVSINSYDSDLFNLYNLLEHSNMNIKHNQSDWLINVMEQAEANSEKVIIVGHIPCTLKSSVNDHWCSLYASIVERFSTIIAAQFYGHTHKDQLVVFTDAATNSKATGMNYVSPCITTLLKHMPSFRLYEYDFTTNEVLNYQQYVTDIREWNANGNMTFRLAYTAKELYNLPDLSPQSWYNLAQEFKTNATLFNNYYQFLYNSPYGPPHACDDNCRKTWTCEIFGVTSQLFDKCLGV